MPTVRPALTALEQRMLLLLRADKFPEPVCQYRFDAARKFRFDFAWPAWRVALEVEGGVFQQGRHQRPDGFERDCEKYSLAAIQGWLVVRATVRMVDDGRALALVQQALVARGWG